MKCLIISVLALFAGNAWAGVANVYSPLVEQGETELEMKGLWVRDNDPSRDGLQKTKVGLGHGMNSRVFLEGYLVFEKSPGDSYELEAYEIEAKFQLSEQGQYFADFGLLTEVEKVRKADEWEVKIGPLLQKPLGNWMATLNLLGETKFGSDVAQSGKWELLTRARLKYLTSAQLEPGLEYYGDEGTQALGPVFYGRINLPSSKLKWQAGWLFGLDSGTDDHTLRWQFEWEF